MFTMYKERLLPPRVSIKKSNFLLYLLLGDRGQNEHLRPASNWLFFSKKKLIWKCFHFHGKWFHVHKKNTCFKNVLNKHFQNIFIFSINSKHFRNLDISISKDFHFLYKFKTFSKSQHFQNNFNFSTFSKWITF